MNIELSEADVHEVAVALSEHADELMKEIVHSDQRRYREELKKRYERLEQLIARLGGRPKAA